MLTAVELVRIFGVPFTEYGGEYRAEQNKAFISLELSADINKGRILQWINEMKSGSKIYFTDNATKTYISEVQAAFHENLKMGVKGAALLTELKKQESYRLLLQRLNSIKRAANIFHSFDIVDMQSGDIMISTEDENVMQHTSLSKYVPYTDFIIDVIEHKTNKDKEVDVTIIYPIINAYNKPSLLAVAHMNPDTVLKPMLKISKNVGETAEALLITEERRNIASLKYPLQDGSIPGPLGLQILDIPATLASRGEEGIIVTNDYRGAPVLAAYRFIPITSDTGWGLIVKRDRAEILASFYRRMIFSFFIIVCVTIVFLVLMSKIIRNITHPLVKLSKLSRKFEDGDFSIRSKVDTHDEVGILSSAFNSMVERLYSWHEELENQVRARTSELQALNEELETEITERKRSEEALRESDERHRTILQTAMDGFWLVDTQGRLLDVNAAYCRISGYSKTELLTMLISDLEAVEAADGIAAHIQKIMMQGEDRFESRHRRKDGSIFDVEVSAQWYLPVEGGQFVAFLQNITERKKAEKALRESEARYIDLYDNAPDMYISVDAGTGRILQCNQTLANELGYTKAEIIGREIIDLYQPDSVEEVKKTLRHFIETGVVHDKELQVLRKDGTVIDISLNSSAVRAEKGRILYSRSSWRNITDKKELERQLLHAQKMESVGTLAGGVAHDFNNILTVIIGIVSILKRRFSKEDPLQTYFDQIDKAAESAANLTRNLLTFSRKQKNYPTLMDLNEIVRKQEKFLVRVMGEDIEFRTKLADKKLFVMADFNQMEQVFMNFAANARDAMPKGGSFTISTKSAIIDNEYIRSHGYGTPGEYALISISDTGVGIDKYTQAKIFEPFFTTKEVDKGTGLGLSLVYGIIKQHNGYINIRSEPGEGTTFSIYLPLKKDPAEYSDNDNRIESLPHVEVTETILVAEDSAALRNLIAFVLTEAGYKVITAEDGEDALTKFMDNSDRIQLALLDVIMPKKNGKEVYDAIKKIKGSIKVLFLSGYSEEIIHQRDIIKEGIEIIPKPIKPGVLLCKIREELDRV
jgi:PAS domain S-box-containing protein